MYMQYRLLLPKDHAMTATPHLLIDAQTSRQDKMLPRSGLQLGQASMMLLAMMLSVAVTSAELGVAGRFKNLTNRKMR